MQKSKCKMANQNPKKPEMLHNWIPFNFDFYTVILIFAL